MFMKVIKTLHTKRKNELQWMDILWFTTEASNSEHKKSNWDKYILNKNQQITDFIVQNPCKTASFICLHTVY